MVLVSTAVLWLLWWSVHLMAGMGAMSAHLFAWPAAGHARARFNIPFPRNHLFVQLVG
jgi:hypothetical protein